MGQPNNALTFSSVVSHIGKNGKISIPCGAAKMYAWFAAINAAVVISLVMFSAGAFISLVPIFLVIGFTWPFINLLFSRYFATKAYNVEFIDPLNFKSNSESELYSLIESLRIRSDLPVPLGVGTYVGEDMNAFATGPSRKKAIVVFSSGLLENMTPEEIAAVAAHEVAHIANGDMLTMVLVQAIVNGIVMVLTMPLKLLQLALLVSKDSGWAEHITVWIVDIVFTAILMFFGNLGVKYFSRQREFSADALAARLTDKRFMVSALMALGKDSLPIIPEGRMAYATLRINSPKSWHDIFSTHPSLERRIQALDAL